MVRHKSNVKQGNNLPPRECLLKRQGRSFSCKDLSLPLNQECTYCREVLPAMIAERQRQQEEYEALMEAVEIDLFAQHMERGILPF